jgi:hypothetical protein
MPTITLPPPSERSRFLAVRELRLKNLERLYERRALVDVLIRCLEEYQRGQQESVPPCLDLTAMARSSSGFAQSRI